MILDNGPNRLQIMKLLVILSTYT